MLPGNLLFEASIGEHMSLTIQLNNIGHDFQDKDNKIHLFDDLSFTLAANTITAISGASGSGKSTLLAILAGLLQPISGEVFYNDHSVGEGVEKGANKSAINSKNINRFTSFIFQQFHLLSELDALNNVALPLRLKGHADAFEQAEEWLVRVGLKDRIHHSSARLSGGEQQRVAIARAFVSKPKIIFADEPTGSLDENTAQYIAQLMRECCHEHACSMVVVTHNPELFYFANSNYRLGHGRMELLA
ncbi:MAG: putative ABC transport system ATP-binding protein [Paraglaciecola sp.]